MRYVAVDGKIIIFPENAPHQDWVANVGSTPIVKIYTDSGVHEGRAAIKRVEGIEDPLLAIFSRKYGTQQVRQRYWGQFRYVEVELTGQLNKTDLVELVYGDLEAAFDGVAEDYDQHIFGNPMNIWLRDVSVGLLKQLFKPGDIVLEIGCGTGTETLVLASSGVKVIASDISSKMLQVLSRKAENSGLSDNVIPLHARPYQLRERVTQLGYPQIDGAYSTYGAVNTEPKLQTFFRDLHRLLKPGGTLLLGVWNKYYLYEILGYSLRLRPSMVTARMKSPVPVGRSRFCVSSNSYSVRSLNRLMSEHFALRKVYGIEILLPPSNLTRYLPPEPLLSLFKKVDLVLGQTFPWNRLGDHFLAVYVNLAT